MRSSDWQEQVAPSLQAISGLPVCRAAALECQVEGHQHLLQQGQAGVLHAAVGLQCTGGCPVRTLAMSPQFGLAGQPGIHTCISHLFSSREGRSMAVSHVEWTSRNVSQPRVALMASYEEAPG